MRRMLFVVTVVMLASCKLQTLAAAVAFEGEIDLTTSMPGVPSMTLTTAYELKGTKVRTSTKGFTSYAIIADAEAKKYWTIDDAARTYSEMDVTKITAASTAKKPTATARKTGRSDTVAGYSCDVWQVDDVASHAEICVASGLSMLSFGIGGPFSMFAKGNDGWSDVMSRGFPLRMTMRDASGALQMTMEATRIDKKSLPDSDFAIPAGYTKTTSPI